MKPSKKHARVHINWNRVIDKGTGFFGKRFPPWFFGTRHAAMTRIKKAEPSIAKAEDAGANGDFLKACIFHLAELAKDYDENTESFRLAKLSPEIVLSRTSEGLHRIKVMQDTLISLQLAWDRAKGVVRPNDPHPPGENKVDKAFAALQGALEEYLGWYGPEEKPKSPRGRPSMDQFLLVLSGMDRHLQKTTGSSQRSLLSELVSEMIPSLPMATKSDNLRSTINGFRKKRKRNGDTELEELWKEFEALRNKFTVSP